MEMMRCAQYETYAEVMEMRMNSLYRKLLAGFGTLVPVLAGISLGLVSLPSLAQAPYLIQPGDTLMVSVWQEPDLTGEVVVHPDGTFAIPLAGSIRASGRTTLKVQESVSEKLTRFVPDPIVTVGLQETVGRTVYVIGQVNAPGAYNVGQPIDVMQALSLAEGMTAYASENKIKILRRMKDKQDAIGFRYGDVEKGRNLEQNILLEDGDIVVVP
jgi:polysaccharide export outer membrane protein